MFFFEDAQLFSTYNDHPIDVIIAIFNKSYNKLVQHIEVILIIFLIVRY